MSELQFSCFGSPFFTTEQQVVTPTVAAPVPGIVTSSVMRHSVMRQISVVDNVVNVEACGFLLTAGRNYFRE